MINLGAAFVNKIYHRTLRIESYCLGTMAVYYDAE